MVVAWTDEARRLLAEADRREIGNIEIGKGFSHTRGDEDGTWPTKPVRDLIERIPSHEIEQGFQVQIYNDRGSTSRGVSMAVTKNAPSSRGTTSWADAFAISGRVQRRL